ncbi:MAG: lipopolysaccharide heptosyltransferase II [Candidatus Omnitrophota bacterium]|nr:MAG: lipopolysaccharide heptosyltransferase II [Candidatus Omnitrophota bacterium]
MQLPKPHKILIVRTDRLGDVILSTPVIKNLRVAFPQAHIAFMCRPYTKAALEGNPYLDEVIVYDKYGKHKSTWASIKFSQDLRKKKFDWALILHPTNRAHLVTYFAKIPFRIGWDKKMGFLLTERLKHTKQQGRKHETEYTLDILKTLNIDTEDKTTYFPISEKADKKIEELLIKEGLEREEKFIVIHPSASCRSKRWPPDYFSKLVKALKEKTNLKIAVISAAEEKGVAQEIVEKNEVIDLRAKLAIAEVGSLLKRAELFISNDSGPVHIAAALNTPVISIFGRKDPGLSPLRWAPLGEASFYFHKDVGCIACASHNCLKGFLCLKAISPEEVLEAATRLIESRRI